MNKSSWQKPASLHKGGCDESASCGRHRAPLLIAAEKRNPEPKFPTRGKADPKIAPPSQGATAYRMGR
jgi:hypothetical protein